MVDTDQDIEWSTSTRLYIYGVRGHPTPTPLCNTIETANFLPWGKLSCDLWNLRNYVILSVAYCAIYLATRKYIIYTSDIYKRNKNKCVKLVHKKWPILLIILKKELVILWVFSGYHILHNYNKQQSGKTSKKKPRLNN